jgi:hypothetical protein
VQVGQASDPLAASVLTVPVVTAPGHDVIGGRCAAVRAMS